MDIPAGAAPVPSAELFLIPLGGGRHLVYAPLRRAAFVANARTVNILADIHEGRFDPADDPDGRSGASCAASRSSTPGRSRCPSRAFPARPSRPPSRCS